MASLKRDNENKILSQSGMEFSQPESWGSAFQAKGTCGKIQVVGCVRCSQPVFSQQEGKGRTNTD